ncbi:MAG TPA: hypothetical protein VGU68_08265, partial [Ktedonobacteraceae bacterium]|nr:hypothetical protein [Ktedonobacteraceae bacterium]
ECASFLLMGGTRWYFVLMALRILYGIAPMLVNLHDCSTTWQAELDEGAAQVLKSDSDDGVAVLDI